MIGGETESTRAGDVTKKRQGIVDVRCISRKPRVANISAPLIDGL